MAGRIVSEVTFIGNASQLLATYRAIGAQARVIDAQFQNLGQTIFEGKGFNIRAFGQAFKNLPAGQGIQNIKVAMDSANKVFRVSGETFIKTADGARILTGTLEDVVGNTDNFTKAAANATRVHSLADRATERTTTAVSKASDAYKLAASNLDTLTSSRLASTRAAIASINSQERAGVLDPGNARYLRNLEAQRERAFLQSPAVLKARNINEAAYVALLEAEARATQTAARADAIRARADRGVATAINSRVTSFPAGYEQIPPNILRELQKPRIGLPTTPQALHNQGATIKLTEDLIHGTTRASIAFETLQGVQKQGTVEWDRYGKAVTKFGGTLSGVQNLFNQTVRNLQKVIQWTAATSLVFGTLAFAASELGTLVDLDKNLERLSITAQATSSQTKGLFSDLADIAYQTATPLTEVVKAADDIALATRQSGQSAQEYQRDIINLTQAVGIFTNLTGTDTVRATDLLTSSMKQLGIGTEDVIGILSKVTAVAGGQSNAIADITQVLAVMSEAARQAGLTIDETIATAQVLSQVTAKSPAEIATAFKNLTGSLDSVAGKKALEKFNIGLRDAATGELRNILDIYSEISDKIRQGIIPANEVKGLVKAIAGGPRRVPDAAALLSNIDQIQAVTERSVRATNEALVANAKILDTTQAKLTQLQVVVDRFAFERFGPAFKSAVEALLDGLTTLLEILNKLDSGFYTTALQVGAFLLALRLGGGLVVKFKDGLVAAAQGFKASTIEAARATAAIKAYNIAASQRVLPPGTQGPVAVPGGRRTQLVNNIGKENLKNAAGYGLFGAGLSAITGGDLKDIAGTGLQGLGLGLLTAPSPEPFTKLAGAAAFAVGTILQLIPASEDAANAVKNIGPPAEDVVNTFNQYEEAKATVDSLSQSQQELAKAIALKQAIEKPNKDDLAYLSDLQDQYAKNTLAAAEATQKLAEAQSNLTSLFPGFQTGLEAANRGALDEGQLRDLISRYQKELLGQSNPELTFAEDQLIPVPLELDFVPYIAPGQAEEIRGTAQTFVQKNVNGIIVQIPSEVVNLDDIQENFRLVTKLFTNGELTAAFVKDGRSMDIVRGALQKLKADGYEGADGLIKVTEAAFANIDAFRQAQSNIAAYSATVKALAAVGYEDAGELTRTLDLVNKIVNQANIVGGKQGAAAIKQAQDIFVQVLKGATIDNRDESVRAGLIDIQLLTRATAEQLANLYISLLPPDTVVDKNKLIAAILGDINKGYLTAAESASAFAEEALAAAKDTSEAIGKSRDKILGDIAQKTADLQARYQGGEFIDKSGDKVVDNTGIYKAQMNQLEAIQEQAIAVTTAFQEMYDSLTEENVVSFNDALGSVKESLTDINGLQDAQSLTTDQLIERMFSLADTYGLTGKQVDILGGKILKLLDSIKIVNDFKAKFGIQISADTSQALKQMKAIKLAFQVMNALYANIPFFGKGFQTDLSGFDAVISALANIQGFDDTLAQQYKSGKGSTAYKPPSKAGSTGGSTKTAQGPDVSTIDIPDAIANAYNRDALIQEAIRRAKALQAKIPGAAKEASNDIVELLKGTQQILEVRGVKDDLLRRALEELADIEKKRLDFETKADTIRRIRVGSGSFAAIANVPVNSTTGVSLGGANGPINITLNLNGTILTPAQLQQFADLVASALKRQLAG